MVWGCFTSGILVGLWEELIGIDEVRWEDLGNGVSEWAILYHVLRVPRSSGLFGKD